MLDRSCILGYPEGMKQKRFPKDLKGLATPKSRMTGLQPNLAPQKDPAAVALGRKGGLKGGKARAMKLSKFHRSSIAKKAAQARWGRKSDE